MRSWCCRLALLLVLVASPPCSRSGPALPLVEPSTLASLTRAAPLAFCGRVSRVLLPSRREVLSLQMDARARVVSAGGRPVPDDAIAAVLLVTVRTMLKGALPGQRPPQEPRDYLFPRKVVEVLLRGGGSAVEARTLRVLHTAIFLARPDGSRLRLFASPLPMSLRYLDVVRAAAKDMTYTPRPPAGEEPCERQQCPWGAECVLESGRAACRCPQLCPRGAPGDEGPVCGTDGRTYPSECHLRATACELRDGTRLSHRGPCDETEALADEEAHSTVD